MYEDSDPADGISDSEVEAIKRRKEKQAKIMKIIAICTAGIVACGTALVLIRKFKKKDKKSEAKGEVAENKVLQIQSDFKQVLIETKDTAKEKRLTEKESDHLDDTYDKMVRNQKIVDEMVESMKWDPTAKDDDFDIEKDKDAARMNGKFSSDATSEKDKKTEKDKKIPGGKGSKRQRKKNKNKVINASGDTYDRLVDTICEKYNNDEIDAETCVSLLERASERYLMESEEYDDTNEVTFESVVDNICESYIDGEINEEVCKMLIEAATDKYL